MTNSPAENSYDIAVLGAGPSGLAAATSAAQAGARVALLDNGVRPGGQYWRNRADDTGRLHHGWATYTALRADLARHQKRITHLPLHSVWHVGSDGETFSIHATTPQGQRRIAAAAVIVATGAYDRQIPFPGWTLPGVFTAGAVQALLKGHGVLAGKRIVVGGTGPFLLAVAAGLADAGAEVRGVYDASSPIGFARAPLAILRNITKLGEGAHYSATLARHRIPYHRRAAVIAAHGDGEVTSVTTAKLDRDWSVMPGSRREIDCDTVAVGYGFTPQLEIPLQLGCATALDVDGNLIATADDRQRSSVDGVYLAGEVCGVAGAAASVAEGHLAGLQAAAHVSRRPVDPTAARPHERRRHAARTFATAMHTTFPVPPGWTGWLQPDTVVCRCEEVSAAAIGDAVDRYGAVDARSAKLYVRPGMGLCQGRVCGYATSCLVAARAGRTPTADDLRGVAGRPIGQPVTLGSLASPQAHSH